MRRYRRSRRGTDSEYAENMLFGYGFMLIMIGFTLYFMQRHQSKTLGPLLGRYQHTIMDDYLRYLMLVCFVLGPAFVILYVIRRSSRRRKKAAEIEKSRALASNQAEMTAEEFLAMQTHREFTGVYILHNETKDMYYVGQSVRVMQRVRQHLTGHGNGDVYADYKYGDRFTVRAIAMYGSGYMSIDDLERDMIEAYDALNSGHNKTRGNGG